MKVINSRLNGMLDYFFGALLASPYIFEFFAGSPDSIVLASVGGIIIFYSVLTDYELGLIRLLPLKAHLFLDAVSGVFLILTPILFPLYHYNLYWPVIMGIIIVLVAIFSRSVPFVLTRKDLDITKP